MSPRVSVIVPNYNHAGYLPRRLESIFNQTFTDYEVILLDDCSTDNSYEVLSKYANDTRVSHFIVNDRNSGSTFKQISRGIKLAKGEFIWIAESDDWAEYDFLDKTVKKAQKNIGIIYSQSFIVNDQGDKLFINTKYTDYLDKNKWKEDFVENGVSIINSFFVFRNIIPNMSAVLLSREDLLTIIIENDLKYMGDWFIYCQILLRKDLSYISEPLNNYREHLTSVRTKALINGLREKEYYYLLKFLKSHPGISKKAISKQFLINTRFWFRKWSTISTKMHFKIAIQFFKFFV